MIIEQAGGIASTGMFEGKIQRVIDLVPDSIHAKCPIIMVRRFLACLYTTLLV